jgi:hypothetical protein
MKYWLHLYHIKGLPCVALLPRLFKTRFSLLLSVLQVLNFFFLCLKGNEAKNSTVPHALVLYVI